MRRIFALLCLFLPASLVKAQEMDYDLLPVHNKSIQLNFGTQGAGAEFNYGLFSQLALRAGVDFIPVKLNNAFPIPGYQLQHNRYR